MKVNEPFNFCACIGPIYGEPCCPCEMKKRGIPPSPDRIKAIEESERKMKDIFKGDNDAGR
jgi:hypothetical protein